MPKATIRLAILNRKLLGLYYRQGSRVVEPYIYGADDVGKELLRVYQTSGDKKYSQALGWKLFNVAGIGAISLLRDNFTPRPDYQRKDLAISKVFLQV